MRLCLATEGTASQEARVPLSFRTLRWKKVERQSGGRSGLASLGASHQYRVSDAKGPGTRAAGDRSLPQDRQVVYGLLHGAAEVPDYLTNLHQATGIASEPRGRGHWTIAQVA